MRIPCTPQANACRFGALLGWAILWAAMLVGQAAWAEEEAKVDYARQIKPILSNHCYACHGPDENQRKADLRLDDAESALAAAIVPNQADDSEMLRRILSQDPDEKMPPTAAKKPPLTAEEIELLRRWIDQGAEFQLHWSYQPRQRPKVPAAPNASWSRNEIDHFVARARTRQKFDASPVADRRTLIRRLYFDLIGLPPKPAEVDAFVNDTSDKAYENLVDRLMDSQHYGERLAIYWLDLVRYADTNGIHSDNHREHDWYRDYVIEAFNSNMPFDRFTTEQLAGDLLPGATKQQRIASGYNRLNLTTQEGGSQPKEFIAKYAADRVRNASVVWMGSTLGCAQCHNHKFDPFTTRDFYSFAAFFADIQETPVGRQPPARIPTDEQEAEVKKIDGQLTSLRKTLNTQTSQLDQSQAKWEQSRVASLTPWTTLAPVEMTSKQKVTLERKNDNSVLAKGANPDTDTYTVTAKTGSRNITAFRLELLTDGSLPKKGPGRAGNGNLVLTELTVEAAGKDGVFHPVELQNATATFEQKGAAKGNPYGLWSVASAIDRDAKGPKFGWAIMEQVGQPNHAVFETKQDLAASEDTTLRFTLAQNHGTKHTLGKFRLSVASRQRPVVANKSMSDQLVSLLSIPLDKRSDAQRAQVSKHYRTIAPELAAARKQVADLDAKRKSITDAYRAILVSMQVKPRVLRILPRGNWLDESGEIVQAAVPKFLGQVDATEGRATRLDLAKWLLSPENPLVARVFVNRLWKLMFGRGIVTTLDDYGAQGTIPSHPELLDWLASEFVESGWNVKHVVKLMVMSQTYQQSSLESQQLRQLDPANTWLARQGRFRIDAELVRDNALAISGLLVDKIGGPSVKPYQPPGYWAHLNFPRRSWKHDAGENQYRRGMYTYWCRTFPHPSALAFDAQSREESCVERPRSNTPLQALVLLNDPTYVEAARAFATRIVKEGGKTEKERLDFAFREAVSRRPNAAEYQVLTKLYEKHVKQFTDESNSAKELLSVGDSKPPADIAAAELAAWTSIARVILNLHETITRN